MRGREYFTTLLFPRVFFFCERGGVNDVVDMTTVKFPEMNGKIVVEFIARVISREFL